MIRINVKEFLGTDRLISSDKANELFIKLKKYINQNKEIILDFTGINIAITKFFHEAIGSLYGEFEENKVDNLLKYENTPKPIQFMLKKAIDSAKKYYKNPEKYEKLNEEVYAML